MKLSVVVDLVPALQNMLAQIEKIEDVKDRPPARVQSRAVEALRAVGSEFESFEADRAKLAQEIGTPLEDGKGWSFEGEAAEKWRSWLDKRLAEDLEMAPFAKIPVDDLDGLPITTEQMAGLLPILKDEG